MGTKIRSSSHWIQRFRFNGPRGEWAAVTESVRVRFASRAIWNRIVRPSQWTVLAIGLKSRLLPSLSQADFARLWRGNIGSTTAHVMQTVAVGWLVVELTDSPFMLGLITFFRFAPMLLLSPIGGVFADRFNRVRLILIAQSAMGHSGACDWPPSCVRVDRSLASHTWIARNWGSFSINVPSRHAMMADLVPRKDVANAVGLNNVSWSASSVVGPSIAGFLISAAGIASAYFAQVAAYAWSILNITRIKITRARVLPRESMFTSLRQGYMYVLHSKPLVALIILTGVPP